MTLAQAEQNFFEIDGLFHDLLKNPAASWEERVSAYHDACEAADLLYVVRDREMRTNVLQFPSRRMA